MIGQPRLTEDQQTTTDRICNILTTRLGYIDTSETGAGKTYVAIAVALALETDILVIAPQIVLSKWMALCAACGVRMVGAISYQMLISKRNSQPSHGLLERYDEPGKPKDVAFLPTDEYLNLVDDGLLLILDEAHSVKNHTTITYKAVMQLMTPILQGSYTVANDDGTESVRGGRSRYGLLSATPVDKPTMIIKSTVHLTGYCTYQKLFSSSNGVYNLLGAQEILDACLDIDDEATRAIEEEYPILDRNTIPLFCYRLATGVLFRDMSVFTPLDAPIVDSANGFYNIQDSDTFEEALASLSDTFRSRTLADYGSALAAVEAAKIDDMIRVTLADLQRVPHCKVAIYVSYVDSIQRLEDGLIDYNPVVVNGQTRKRDRDGLIATFNEPNDYCRVFIGNPTVAGMGIDLDDKDGGFPRILYYSASYSVINGIQGAGRIRRQSTCSIPTVRIFYGKSKTESNLEMQIHQSMVKKSNTIDDLLSRKQPKDHLPSHWPIIEESDPEESD
jgi:superfamily II DNA or RNA helicase